MKKRDLYEIGLKVFGFYLIINFFLVLIGNLQVSITLNTYGGLGTNNVKGGLLTLILIPSIYLIFGVLFLFKTSMVLKILRLDNNDTQLVGFNRKTLYHITVIVLGGLMLISSLTTTGKSSRTNINTGKFENTIIRELEDKEPTGKQIGIHNEKIPQFYNDQTYVEYNVGSICGIVFGVIIIVFSQGLSRLLIPKENLDNKDIIREPND